MKSTGPELLAQFLLENWKIDKRKKTGRYRRQHPLAYTQLN